MTKKRIKEICGEYFIYSDWLIEIAAKCVNEALDEVAEKATSEYITTNDFIDYKSHRVNKQSILKLKIK